MRSGKQSRKHYFRHLRKSMQRVPPTLPESPWQVINDQVIYVHNTSSAYPCQSHSRVLPQLLILLRIVKTRPLTVQTLHLHILIILLRFSISFRSTGCFRLFHRYALQYPLFTIIGILSKHQLVQPIVYSITFSLGYGLDSQKVNFGKWSIIIIRHHL